MVGGTYAYAAMQAEPQPHATDPETDEETAAFIRRWLDLAKAVIKRERPEEDAPEAPTK